MNIEYHEVSGGITLSFSTTYHAYTLPFEFVKFCFIDNMFTNILFHYVTEHRCEASTKELARTNDMLAKNFFTKYLPSMETTPFDSEFNSAPNGGTFIHGRNFRKVLSGL